MCMTNGVLTVPKHLKASRGEGRVAEPLRRTVGGAIGRMQQSSRPPFACMCNVY